MDTPDPTFRSVIDDEVAALLHKTRRQKQQLESRHAPEHDTASLPGDSARDDGDELDMRSVSPSDVIVDPAEEAMYALHKVRRHQNRLDAVHASAMRPTLSPIELPAERDVDGKDDEEETIEALRKLRMQLRRKATCRTAIE